MRWRIRLTASAQHDIAAIRHWTHQQFGARQALTYAKTLSLAMQALGDGPEPPGFVRRDDLARGVCTLHVARKGRQGRHLVVFRASPGAVVDVLRVLHDSMDLPQHLAPSRRNNAPTRP